MPHTSPRKISQSFYKSKRWLQTRDDLIKRDLTFDLAVFGIYIDGPIYMHHINPITEEDIVNLSDCLFDPENLIATSLDTHNLIHYGSPEEPYKERTPNDTKLW